MRKLPVDVLESFKEQGAKGGRIGGGIGRERRWVVADDTGFYSMSGGGTRGAVHPSKR